MSLRKLIQPEGWKQPRGYSNGILTEGRMLFVGGQVGWDGDEVFVSDVFHEQWDRALANVLEVVAAAGGGPEHIVKMTIYVKDKHEYLDQRGEIGTSWKLRMGRNYPTMALVQIADFVEDRAKVEIEAMAVLPLETK